jgi:Na+/proline symporter
MNTQHAPAPLTVVAAILVAILLLAGGYWGVNAYLFTSGENANTIAVAASAALASPFIVGAIFIVVAMGISTMNAHLDHISECADEEVKLLRYQVKLTQQLNKKELLLSKLSGVETQDEFTS